MNEEITAQILENRSMAAWRHDAVPSLEFEELREPLAPIDWSSQDIPPEYVPSAVPLETPKRPPAQHRGGYTKWPADEPFPRADAVILTWTSAEWAALHHVFCGWDQEMRISDVTSSKAEWRKGWLPYARDYHQIREYMDEVKYGHMGGAPSLYDKQWGKFCMVKIGEKNVLLVKSGMHLAQDGPLLPLCQFTEKILDEAAPELVLSIGTAGAVRDEDALGSALITRSARFYLLGEFKDAGFNNRKYTSDWALPDRFLDQAQGLVIQVSGFPVYRISPQYPDTRILPDEPNSRLKLCDDPIITTDTFLFGTTENRLDKYGCMVEMDDAVIAMVCDQQNDLREANVRYAFVRNASDPVMDSRIGNWNLQKAWAGYVYEQKGIYTSVNGALGAWAIVAGWAYDPDIDSSEKES